jgi:hypothetical protein
METLAVPFTNRFWTDTYDATVTVRGVLRTEPDGLVLEFRRSEFDYASARKEDAIQSVHLPWTEIQSLAYRKRFLLGGVLHLRTRTLRALEGVPRADGSEMSLAVARRDRMAARELAAEVELHLAEQRIAALESPAPRSALPPA